MAYTKKIWKDYPDTTTQIKAEDLNNIENGIEAVDTALENLENNVNNIEDGLEAVTNNVNNGWISLNGTFTFVSWDSTTYTGVVNSNLDLTSYLSVGMKIKFTQNSAIKYAFITAITSTQLTLFLGTDYSINNSAISNTYYSMLKTPYGFPIKYSQEIYSTTEQVVGMWIDGKPIYRKVFAHTMGTALNSWETIGTIPNIDFSVRMYGLSYNGSSKFPVPFFEQGSTQINVVKLYCDTSSKLFRIQHNYTYANNQPGYYIIEYTKTTD